MDRSVSEQSLGEHNIDVGYSQPSTSDITEQIQISFEQSYLQEPEQFTTEIPADAPLTDGFQGDRTPESLDEVITWSSLLIPSVINDESLQLPEAHETVGQVTSTVEELFQHITTGESQQTGSSIDNLILHLEPTTTSKILLGEVKQKKMSKRKKNWVPITIYLEDEEEEEKEKKPLKPILDDYTIPESFTEFIYDGETVPVYVEQLYGTPLIGHGGFGSVYGVVLRDPRDILMAVKRLPRSAMAEVKTLEIVGSGACPNIIDYYCAVINPGTAEMCICMEFMDASLFTFYQTMHLLNEIPFDKLDHLLRRILHNCATALFYLQIKDIVHRDIKPHNILINQNAVIKLCDFGISITFAEMQLDTTVETGTANYIPPFRGHNIQDDMFALGISLLEIIQGKNPFVTDSNGKTASKIGWRPPALPTISPDMENSISYLLQHHPRHRPHSYEDILNWPCVYNVSETSSNEECEFVRDIIGQIPPPGNSD